MFTVLAPDHGEVKDMQAELEQGLAEAAEASQDQLTRRKKLTKQLIIALETAGPAAAGKARDAVTGRGAG